VPNATELTDILTHIQRLDREHAAELADVTDRHRRERGALLARLLLIASPKADGLSDLLKPKEAQREFKLSKRSLFRLGQKHPMGTPGGFCFVNEHGKRMYSKSLLSAHLRLHPLRRQRAKPRAAAK
jgi:hypothetical protein